MSEDELRTVIREFKASVSAQFDTMSEDIAAIYRRMDEFAEEVRDRLRQTDDHLRTVEASFFNSLRDLSQTVDRRFGRVDGRLDSMDGRLDSMDGRLDSMDGRLDGIDGRLDRIDGRLDDIDGRLDDIDGRLDRMDGRLDGIDGRLGGIEGQLTVIIDRLPPAA